MENISTATGRVCRREAEHHPRKTFRENLRSLGSRLLPHDTRHTTCPPAPLVSGSSPLIIVASIMRSGTHLLLDSLFNNFPQLRRTPLFVDFDAYERAALPPVPLNSLTGAIIKTHFPHTPLAGPYAAALARLAANAIVLTPSRTSIEVRRSLAKWGQVHSATEFSEIKKRFDSFWTPFSPHTIEFPTLLDPVGIESVIQTVATLTGFKPRQPSRPVMPAHARFGVYCDKMLTRMLGPRAPRINTTIGYRLAPRQLA